MPLVLMERKVISIAERDNIFAYEYGKISFARHGLPLVAKVEMVCRKVYVLCKE